MKNFKEIADRAEKEAREIMAAGEYTIDMGDSVKADGITGYQARQIHGEAIDARIAARVTLESALREIRKGGAIGKGLSPEAAVEYRRLDNLLDELGLNEEEE